MNYQINTIDIEKILEKYDAIFLDSFGVLIDGKNLIKGADKFIDRLNIEKFPYLILTNDASLSNKNRSGNFNKLGINLNPEKIISAGDLIQDFMNEINIIEYPCVVLGSKDTHEYALKSKVNIINIEQLKKSRSIIIGHSKPYDWEETLNLLLNLLSEKVSKNENYDVIFPNPDFLYPNGNSKYGFGSASFGYLLESGFKKLHKDYKKIIFHKLGKPNEMIFRKAKERINSKKPIMIGDQLETDILGGNNFGIDTALVLTGLDSNTFNQKNLYVTENMLPKYILSSLTKR